MGKPARQRLGVDPNVFSPSTCEPTMNAMKPGGDLELMGISERGCNLSSVIRLEPAF